MSSTHSLPHSEECERAVLAAVLLAPAQVMPHLHGRLPATDFYVERHRLIYRAYSELWSDQVEIDLRTVQAWLEREGGFASAGGLAYLAGLDLDLPDLSRVDNYVRIIQNRALVRRLIRGCSKIAADCHQGLEPSAAVTALRHLVDDVNAAAPVLVPPISAAVEQAFEYLLDREEAKSWLRWGIGHLDTLTQGLHAGQLVVLGGRPGMGKSALAQSVVRTAVGDGHKVLWVSLEMSGTEIVCRLVSTGAQVALDAVLSAQMSTSQWSQVYAGLKALRDLPVYLPDRPLSVTEIEAAATMIGPALVVVDYLQLLGGGHPNRHQELAAITRRLKVLAQRLGLTVLLLSQLNRDPARRASRKPGLADLRDSGAIEADADVVLFIHRESVYEPGNPSLEGQAEILVRKQRNGPLGDVLLKYDGPTVTFYEDLPDRQEAL